MPNRERPFLLTIGQLAQRAGATPSMLRFYEREGLLGAAQRSAAGYRLYPESALRHLEIVKELKETGYTLRDIKELFFARKAGN